MSFSGAASSFLAAPPGAGLLDRYLEVRNATHSLCAPLSADDQMVQSTPEASPVKWHQAHTTWFFETFILLPYLPHYQTFHPAFRFLFNSYYKQLGAHPLRTIRSTFSRPGLEQVKEYRCYVDHYLEQLLAADILEPAISALVELGLNHEQQHQELMLTDIKHAFWSNPLQPGYLNRPLEEPTGQVDELRWREFDAGLYEIGHSGNGFSFDNEGPRHKQYLEAFRLASRSVTNGEYLEFIEDGGYTRPELWLSDGWDTVQAGQWQAPLYWERGESGWTVFTMGGVRTLRTAEPVCHVSYYEADAFARWAGARLPREGEWEVAARNVPLKGNFMEERRLHPLPAPRQDHGSQMFGDVWEWTASPYSPYPDYRPAEGVLGEYNGKFMCNQLVLRGGSCATPRSHIRASYRNFFAPQMRWQFSGIRLANGLV